MTYVFRNNTSERFLSGDYVFSGYDDFSAVPKADSYLWWYQVPIKHHREQLVAEVQSYVQRLQWTVNQIGDRSFPCSGGADKGNLLPRLSVNGNIMEYFFSGLVGEVYIHHPNISMERRKRDRTVGAVRMAPRPLPGAVVGLNQLAVLPYLHIHQGDIAFIFFRLLIQEPENAGGACTGHDNRIKLLRKVVDITRELPGHTEKRHQN